MCIVLSSFHQTESRCEVVDQLCGANGSSGVKKSVECADEWRERRWMEFRMCSAEEKKKRIAGS